MDALLRIEVARDMTHGESAMTFDVYLVRWSALHGDAVVTWPIRIWLRSTYALAVPFRRLHPNVITASGLLIALGVVALDSRMTLSDALLAIFILLLGVIDSLDGIVATVTNRNSTFGAFLDSLVDRGIEVAIILLLLHHGAPLAISLIALCLALLHEYMRARAMGLGLGDVGIITVAEKPTRIAIGVMFFVACSAIPKYAEVLVSMAVYVWAGLGLVGCAQFFGSTKRRLNQA